ncbi:MAG: 7-carboxy-7-deazaguanine synthase QueE [bacterium]|nr:7-carboxy-7-deazaguanine synthase QueE [bacterium]
MNNKAYIYEIFDSIQGEGIYQGLRQVFIRFSGCNLRCKFCDTSYALEKPKTCKVFNNREIINPIIIEELECIIDEKKNSFHSLALTGGEPLLQSKFIKAFLSKRRNFKIYLETNGILYKELEKVIDYIDIISMDIKIHSFLGQRLFKEEHKEFLKIANNKDLFVKIVITDDTTLDEVKEAAGLIESINKNIPLILQPVSSLIGKYDSFCKFLEFQEKLAEMLNEVRIIPQIHKILKIR